ncbi:hypothetical protein H6P81_016577 [Aristolochia fimbriata]|uniref:Protein ABCI7, chloroplastic n=1 Tax=Aristolochia fimbriata TaxID=158543 RepID=A0AAV7E8R6_ARIFI|nr:hypothetical protein H6P81_016577 [Aristolochia fimbriata]
MASTSFSFPSRLLHRNPTGSSRNPRKRTATVRTLAALSDPYVLQLAETFEDSLSSAPSADTLSLPILQNLRDSSSASLLSKTWPSSKDEPFRFTDVSFLKKSEIAPVSTVPSRYSPENPQLLGVCDGQSPSLFLIDGRVVETFSDLSGLPSDVFVGSVSAAPESVLRVISDSVANFSQGDLFWDLNGMGALDIAVIHVPAGTRIEKPLYLRLFSSQGVGDGLNTLPVSNPRCIVVVEKGAYIEIIEEYFGGEEGESYWTNSVMEVAIADGGRVRHSYLQMHGKNAAHIKWTLVRQEASSGYELVEVSTGAKLSRHNLHIQQLGPDTQTNLSALHLCGCNQLQDLHSRLVLDHPRGEARQLHKSIVSHSSGRGVFDGNIQVNRYAQQTDAGQMSRNLLLVPRATVDLKPNLQIIADDVQCSHGATMSDLETEPLFYFQARGIDLQTARKALLFSFGAEVTALLHTPLRKRVEDHVKRITHC